MPAGNKLDIVTVQDEMTDWERSVYEMATQPVRIPLPTRERMQAMIYGFWNEAVERTWAGYACEGMGV